MKQNKNTNKVMLIGSVEHIVKSYSKLESFDPQDYLYLVDLKWGEDYFWFDGTSQSMPDRLGQLFNALNQYYEDCQLCRYKDKDYDQIKEQLLKNCPKEFLEKLKPFLFENYDDFIQKYESNKYFELLETMYDDENDFEKLLEYFEEIDWDWIDYRVCEEETRFVQLQKTVASGIVFYKKTRDNDDKIRQLSNILEANIYHLFYELYDEDDILLTEIVSDEEQFAKVFDECNGKGINVRHQFDTSIDSALLDYR